MAGEFNEVGAIGAETDKSLSTMIKSFGGKAQARFSKNTTHLLAGKDAAGDKFKQARQRNMKVINLRRMEQLLLGRITLDELNRLDALTKYSF